MRDPKSNSTSIDTRDIVNTKLKRDNKKLAEQNARMLAMLKRALPWMTDTLQEAKPDDRYIVNDIYTYLAEIER